MGGTMNFDNMLNKPLRSVELSNHKERITFRFQDGSHRSFGVEGDCCSQSWIEHLDVPNDLVGAVITSVEDGGGIPWDGHICLEEVNFSRSCGHDHLQVYNTRFFTNRGTIVLEYRNDSNGYYGGCLVDIQD